MNQVKFIGPQDLKDSDVEWVVKRLSQIVEGFDDFYKKESGDGWSLGRGNNWFLRYNNNEKSFTLTHRYRVLSGQVTCEAFKRTIVCLLGWEDYNYKPILGVTDSGK